MNAQHSLPQAWGFAHARERAIPRTVDPRRSRPRRIVILDDCEGPRNAYVVILREFFAGTELVVLEDSNRAWHELVRKAPDLFITDITHVGISCREMLSRLSRLRVKFPILVISAVLELFDADERRAWGPGLDVCFMAKPFRVRDFQIAVADALQGAG